MGEKNFMPHVRRMALAVALVGSVALPASALATPLGPMLGTLGSAADGPSLVIQAQMPPGPPPQQGQQPPAGQNAGAPGQNGQARGPANAGRTAAPGGQAVVRRAGPGGPAPVQPRRNGWGNAAGAAAAAGIAGAVIGGIIASQNPGPVYAAPPPPPPRAYGADPDWVAYCARRYRTFDARTGTYLGADGRRYMCE